MSSRRHRTQVDTRTIREAMRAWQQHYGRPPTSYDWSRTHASRRGREALRRLQDREWPPTSTVSDVYGSWAAARADAFPDAYGTRRLVELVPSGQTHTLPQLDGGFNELLWQLRDRHPHKMTGPDLAAPWQSSGRHRGEGLGARRLDSSAPSSP